MKIHCICIGKTDEPAIQQLSKTYHKRLPKYIQFTQTEIPDIKNRKSLTAKQQKQKEAVLILQKIQTTDYVILLDEKGKEHNSKQIAKAIEKLMQQSIKTLVIVIGGPYGLDDSIYERANAKWSFSKLTFTHQMIRLFLAEQIYRAFSIIENKPYHHE